MTERQTSLMTNWILLTVEVQQPYMDAQVGLGNRRMVNEVPLLDTIAAVWEKP